MKLRAWALALDRWFNAQLGGPKDQTASQTVGIEQLARTWWARPVALILELINLERWHCLRSLYGRDGRPIWPDRMPEGAPMWVGGIPGWASRSRDWIGVSIALFLALMLLMIVGFDVLARAASGGGR